MKLTRLNLTTITYLFMLSLVSCWFIIDCTFEDSNDFEAISLIMNVSLLDPGPISDCLASHCPAPVHAGRAETRAGFMYRLGIGP